MDITFFIDRETGEPHIARHGVETLEAIEVLTRAEIDYNGQEGTRIAVGQTRNGRYLRVVYRLLEDGSRFVITAYDLPSKAKAALRRRRKRKRK
jgi:hypothetical protein